jgi:hypothetical protein
MHISVEAPSRGNGRSLPGGIQRQQEEPGAVSGGVSADSVQKSPLELSNSTISTEAPAQKPSIARAPLNRRNIPIEAPARSSASSTYPGGIQRLETSDVKEQEESTESLQMQPQGAIGPKSSEGEPQEKEEQNQELVQTKLTVGAPGDKYEQEADSMAAKVMTMPDSAIQQPIQRQTGEETEAVQMQPLVNSITPLVQRSSEEEEEGKMKSGVQRASDGSSVASGSVENRLAGSKGGGSPLPDDVRSFMEPRFGADFSNIKVHTDSNAVQMNKELGAQAFAHGSDIYYGAGKSPGKNELTAHELTHTIQQGAAVRMNKEVRRSPNQQFEEKEQLQAKKLPDRTLKDSLNKELRLQPLQEQEETEPLQAKELPGHNPEVSLNKELRRQPEETPDGVIQAKTLESGFTSSPLSIQRGIGDKRKAVTGIKQKIGGIKQGVVGFLKDKGNRLKEKLGIKKPPEAGKEGAQRDPKEATNKAGNSFGGEINSGLGRGVDVPTGTRPDVDMPSAKQPEVKPPETAVKPPQTEVKAPETGVKSPETGVKPPETKAEVKAPGSEVESSTAGQSKMATGAANGKDPTPDTIREGSVRMEEHPQYQETIRQVTEAGFAIEFSDDYVCVEVKEVVDSDGNVIRVEKTLYVQENMRYLDLEHELGHIKQQERFGGNMLTRRVIEKNGREKESKIKDGILTVWQDTITEYHNRLDEFIRLYERGASPELLKEHAKGVEEWYTAYCRKGLKNGNSQSQKQWADKYFPDINALRSRYLAIVRTIEQ